MLQAQPTKRIDRPVAADVKLTRTMVFLRVDGLFAWLNASSGWWRESRCGPRTDTARPPRVLHGLDMPDLERSAGCRYPKNVN